MEKIKVKLTRDAVCLADDIQDNSHTFDMTSSATLNDVFEYLKEINYLASVAGVNHSWQAVINGEKITHFKGNQRTPQPSQVLDSEISKYAINGELDIFFQYKSAPN